MSEEQILTAPPAAPETKIPGLSGSALKWAAVVSMLIDHVGATVVEKLCLPFGGPWWNIYWAMRLLGRLAFPLFCFLLVEGFVHTHSRKKYALRLGAFAVLSELPFDLAFGVGWLDAAQQNVFWTLLLGFLAVWTAERIASARPWRHGWTMRLAQWGAIALFAAAAYLLKTDYGGFGVVTIAPLYLLRTWEWPKYFSAAAVLFFASSLEVAGYPAFYLMHVYNGTRGGVRSRAAQYAFYVFYPAHLLLLGLIVRLCA